MMRIFFLFLFVLAMPNIAYAACAGPAGVKGEFVYNDDYNTLQFCDGTNWIGMTGSGGGGGAGVTDGDKGDITVSGSGASWMIDDDVLDFTEFKDALSLDASTDIAISGSMVLSLTNSGTGNSFVVNDQASDTTPFVIDAAGNVGIGLTTPTQALDVAGKITGNSMIMKAVTGAANPTAGAGGWLTNGTNVWRTSGRVGIGTASPGTELHVDGGTGWGQVSVWGELGPGVRLKDTNAPVNAKEFLIRSDGGKTYFFSLTDGGGVQATPMVIDNLTGNVGVKVSPVTEFQVGQALTFNGNWPGVNFNIENNANLKYIISDSASNILQDYGADGLAFNTYPVGTAGATASGGTRMFIRGSDGNVGIGTTSPGARLQIADGNDSLAIWQGGGDNTISIQTLLDNTALGSYGTYGGGQNRMILQPLVGQVGIGVDPVTYKLHVAGVVAGNGAYVNTSDARLKKDVADLDYGLDVIQKLRPVSFHWIDQTEEWQQGRKLGLIAQEAEKVVPEIVTTAKDTQGTKSIAYGDLSPILIKAVQEQQKQIEVLQARIDRLEAGK
ncbi:MAG TPA: tail fiber domain-containing protein [Alphaproteobacteria bacterium]